MDVSQMTDKQVEEELNRRKKKKLQPPPKITNPDMSKLVQYITESIDEMSSSRREPKDFDHYVSELAITAIYGIEIWPWYREVLKNDTKM